MDNELQKQLMRGHAGVELERVLSTLEQDNLTWNRGLTRDEILDCLLEVTGRMHFVMRKETARDGLPGVVEKHFNPSHVDLREQNQQ